MTEDVGREFAALMSGAHQAANPPAEAPFGWTTDKETGERRPKKTAGRPRKSPSVDELRAQAAEQPPEPPEEDKAPGRHRRRDRKTSTTQVAEGDDNTPKYVPGVITRGVNKLYRRAGKIIVVMDPDVGKAIIAATRNTDEDGGDDSVGAAWEELARANPRIRRWLMNAIAGGAWGQVLAAHAPIALAVIMKDGIRRRIPILKFAEAALQPDDDDPGSGLEPGDLQQMFGMLRGFMDSVATGQAEAA